VVSILFAFFFLFFGGSLFALLCSFPTSKQPKNLTRISPHNTNALV
jgi:hypothetical protein